jgi:tRNA(fMet)-specific endonuclease VapC
MATSTIILDSSILIDFFRKRNKTKSILFQLTDEYLFCLSVMTAFEIQIGIKSERQQYEYQTLMENVQTLPIDQLCIDKAVEIYRFLKSQNAQIGLADLLIGATAVRYDLPLATLNRRHFERIPNLSLIDIT